MESKEDLLRSLRTQREACVVHGWHGIAGVIDDAIKYIETIEHAARSEVPSTMTLEEVESEVARIRANMRDPETAHGYEDELFFRILQHIAHGGANGQELAKAAIESSKLSFARHCA